MRGLAANLIIPVIAIVLLAIPFCACHAAVAVGGGRGCCSNSHALSAMATLPETATAAPRASCCGHCCSNDADASAAPSGSESSNASSPSKSSKPAPRPQPGCSGDSCCVKSAPQVAPWQMPAALFVAIIDSGSALPPAVGVLGRIEWPPTLPLGQPPTPLDCGTLLLV